MALPPKADPVAIELNHTPEWTALGEHHREIGERHLR
jgi:hypothetical protein